MKKTGSKREVQPWGNDPKEWTPERPAPKPAKSETPATRVDGRVARSQRTRAAVLDALIGLLEAGHFKPPAKIIAERSGVSTRSIFQHFPDLETLFSAAVQREVNRFAPVVQPILPEAPLASRLATLIKQRFDLFEQAGNIWRAGLLDEPISTTLQTTYRHLEHIFRVQIEVAFKNELAAVRQPRRKTVVRQLAAATGFHAWYALRRVEELEVGPSQAAMSRMFEALMPE